MKKKSETHRLRIALGALGATVIMGCVAYRSHALSRWVADAWTAQRPTPQHASLVLSGVIEAEQVKVSSITSGRIAHILVSEGDHVDIDAPMIAFDTQTLDAKIDAAKAAAGVAEAALEAAQAGLTPSEDAILVAQVALAEQGCAAARQAVSDTLMLIENPQEIDLQIAGTEGALASARYRLRASLATEVDVREAKDHAASIIDKYGPDGTELRVPVGQGPDGEPIYQKIDVSVPTAAHLAHVSWWQTWVLINSTQARIEGLNDTLAQLRAMRQAPNALVAVHEEALSALAEAEAQRTMAEAQLALARDGAADEQLDVLRARVVQAQTALETLLNDRARSVVRAPSSGTVLDVLVNEGEVALAGSPLTVIADLDPLRLTVYVPESQLARVHIGETLPAHVDAFGDETWQATVRRVAQRAEFTPRSVSTEEKRETLVYAVDLHVPNPEGRLKPGMPAEVTLTARGDDS